MEHVAGLIVIPAMCYGFYAVGYGLGFLSYESSYRPQVCFYMPPLEQQQQEETVEQKQEEEFINPDQ